MLGTRFKALNIGVGKVRGTVNKKKILRNLKRFIIIVLFLQFLLASLCFVVLFPLDYLQTEVGTQEMLEKLEEQEAVFGEPYSYVTLGVWAIPINIYIHHKKNEIIEEGIKPSFERKNIKEIIYENIAENW
jgi:hypothetical protein